MMTLHGKRTSSVSILDDLKNDAGVGLSYEARERMKALLRELAGRPAQEIADELLSATSSHANSGSRDSDDRTIVVLKAR